MVWLDRESECPRRGLARQISVSDRFFWLKHGGASLRWTDVASAPTRARTSEFFGDGTSENWRRVRDSNPRYPSGYAGFQDRCHQPLGQLSDCYTTHTKQLARTCLRCHACCCIFAYDWGHGTSSARLHLRGFEWLFMFANVTEIVEGKPEKKQRSHRLCTKDPRRNPKQGFLSPIFERPPREDKI